jgi:hypothetical protein
VLDSLVEAVRGAAAFASGDNAAPCVILWTDPDQSWVECLPAFKEALPELYVLGSYVPAERVGPAIWLRCVEAKVLDAQPTEGRIPVFYLPGVSRQLLREAETCPSLLQPLVELQYRGVVWYHPNGKDWTPAAFLSYYLGPKVAQDQATADALRRALPTLLKEKVVELPEHQIDADFLNSLLTPDLPAKILSWMSEPPKFKGQGQAGEWDAFCEQCVAEYGFHPERDGELSAAKLLSDRKDKWGKVWSRFKEAPRRYPGVRSLLLKLAPAELAFDAEPYAGENDRQEDELRQALLSLADNNSSEAGEAIVELERQHKHRRNWVWAELGYSQLALALEHLALLAEFSRTPLAGASSAELAELYVRTGWRADAAALAALACCSSVGHEEPVCTAVRAVYLHWLDESARNLQRLASADTEAVKPRLLHPESSAGRVVLFADGLRLDVGQRLAGALKADGLDVSLEWDWAPFPGVTATAKPYVVPLATQFTGSEDSADFAVSIDAEGKKWTQDRFTALLEQAGITVLRGADSGDPTVSAWVEAGSLDVHGHNEGWKFARNVEREIGDLTARIKAFLDAGWREVVVVTDHGWVVMPDGLPKVELPKFLVESRWGRCAALKQTTATDLPVLPWHWRAEIQVASPPGVGCFVAGMEYAHGGISVQEMVVPRLTVRRTVAGVQVKLADMKWVGLRCRVAVQPPIAGQRVDIRTRAADAATSRVEGAEPRQTGADGTVSLPMADNRDEGTAAFVVLLADDGRVLDLKNTVIGG